MKEVKVINKKAVNHGVNGSIISLMVFYAVLLILAVLAFSTNIFDGLAESAAPVLEINKENVSFYIGCFIISILPSVLLSFASLSRNRKIIKTILIYILTIGLFVAVDYLLATYDHWLCKTITGNALEIPLVEIFFIIIVCQIGFLVCHLLMFMSVSKEETDSTGFLNSIVNVIRKVLIFKDESPTTFIWIASICLTVFACFVAYIALIGLPLLLIVWFISSAPDSSNMSLDTYDFRDYTYTISNSMGCEETLTYSGSRYIKGRGMEAGFVSSSGSYYYTTDGGQTFIEEKLY